MLQGNTSDKIPLYTRVGWITAWIFIFAILAIALRIFLGAVDYSRKTDPADIKHYLALGLKNGRQCQNVKLPEAVMKNPLLRNAYNKGFREGWDATVIDLKK